MQPPLEKITDFITFVLSEKLSISKLKALSNSVPILELVFDSLREQKKNKMLQLLGQTTLYMHKKNINLTDIILTNIVITKLHPTTIEPNISNFFGLKIYD